jgi:hypothetical protein
VSKPLPQRRKRVGPREVAPATLAVCPCCLSPLVELLAVAPAGDGTRRVERRCPECGWWGAGVFEEAAVVCFQAELDAARASLEALLDQVVKARMETDVERFTFALACDGVLPEDF